MAYRLGIDIGTNSLGWCLIEVDEKGQEKKITQAGVRIFTDGRGPQSNTTNKADRRQARQARRRRDRYLQRRNFLLDELEKHGLMPKVETERKKLVDLNPYQLRAEALEKELPPFHIGRALFHLNQRRGFKSNRLTDGGEDGLVKQSNEKLARQMRKVNAETLGAFLWSRIKDKKNPKTVRTRRFGMKKEDLYELYPARQMLEDEFKKIWSAQKEHNQELYHDKARDRFHHVIFTQRPLKPQIVGKCPLEAGEDRAPKALPSFQRFRIFQELNHLAWPNRQSGEHRLADMREMRDQIAEALEKQKTLSFSKISTMLKKSNLVDYEISFNLESKKRKQLEGNAVSYDLEKKIGSVWHDWSLEKQDEFVMLLLNHEKEDKDIMNALIHGWKLDEAEARACLEIRLPQGHGHLSAKAIRKILFILQEQGLVISDAIKEAYPNSNAAHQEELRNNLLYYGQVVQGHVVIDQQRKDEKKKQKGQSPSSEDKFGTIPNPTVHAALNQVRRVVNDLIRFYGKPDEIVIELARDLPLGAEKRSELESYQKKNQDNNERIDGELKRLGQHTSGDNRNKYKLWEELGENPHDRCCPYTGERIGLTDLFGAGVEVEHILPFKRTLDNSMANKTLCMRQANRDKGEHSPYEAFSGSPSGYVWEDIIVRADNLPKNKQRRFASDAMNKEQDFLARQLTDTSYIARLVKEYMQSICPKNKIWVVPGRLTALLRGYWGLNSLFKDHNLPESAANPKKNRDDHRHHAVDALVVAMTTRSMLQRVATAAGRGESLDGGRLFAKGSIDPWKGFRDEAREVIDKIIVSHRKRARKQGQLHNDTAYGLTDEPGRVVHRIPISALESEKKIEKIRDDHIRENLLKIVEGLSGKELKQAVEKHCREKNIRRVRIVEPINVIEIKDKSGRPYKGFMPDSNWAYEIFLNKKTGRWDGEIITTFSANQKGFAPKWRDNPDLEFVTRIMINDMFLIEHEGKDRFMRVQKLSRGKITLAEHQEANVAERKKSFDKSPNRLREARARKIDISPAGRVKISSLLGAESVR